MLTAFDVGVGVLVLISAILATARGLTREVLSLATWAGSAAIAIYMWQYHPEIARGYIAEELVADIVAGFEGANVRITRIGPEFDPTTSTITLIAGDDYLADNGNAITFAVTLPGIDLTGAKAVCSASGNGYLPVIAGTAELIDTDTDEPKLRLQWSREQTSVKPSCKYRWGAAIIDAAGKVQTIIGGPLTIKDAAVHSDVVNAALTQL